MKNNVFIIPFNVNFYKNQKQIFVSGPRGLVNLSLFNFFVIKNKTIFFTQSLKIQEIINVKKIVLGLSLGYRSDIEIIGLGLNVEINNNKFVFSLGYSHFISIDIPSVILTKLLKKKIHFYSGHFNLATNFVTSLRQYRVPTSYKKKGILYRKEHLTLKQGKKPQL